jgi:hypothetical protein
MAAMRALGALAAPLKSLRRHLDIAHHVRGRIRLRLTPAGVLLLAPDLAARLGDHAAATPGIRSVRVNAAALSVVIEYVPSVIAPELWDDLIAAPDAEFDRLIGQALPAGHRPGAHHVAG